MAQKSSPDTTQPIEESQILPGDPDVSGWLGLPLRSNEFAPARPTKRRGRGRWLLLGLVVLVVVVVVVVLGGAATALVISSPWSAPTPAPAPPRDEPVASGAPVATPAATPPEKEVVPAKERASRRR